MTKTNMATDIIKGVNILYLVLKQVTTLSVNSCHTVSGSLLVCLKQLRWSQASMFSAVVPFSLSADLIQAA